MGSLLIDSKLPGARALRYEVVAGGGASAAPAARTIFRFRLQGPTASADQ
jgi:hypothetical protein